MWLKAKNKVAYIWITDFIIDGWIKKGHTMLNMFSVLGKQIKSIGSKQSDNQNWTFKTNCTNFFCICLPMVDTNVQLWHQVLKHFWKLWPTQIFGTNFGGGQNFYLLRKVFSTRESTLELTGLTPSFRNFFFNEKEIWTFHALCVDKSGMVYFKFITCYHNPINI